MNTISSRLKNYNEIKKILSEENQVDKCGLEPFDYKQIGSGSVSGIAMKLKIPKENPTHTLIAKVMEYNSSNRREISNYERFKKDVLTKRSPHFPLIWESIDCKDKCHFINPDQIEEYLDDEEAYEKWSEIKDQYCFMLFAELFKGDCNQFCKKYKYNVDLYLSIVSQVLMGLFLVDEKDLAHGDLHCGNVLYSYIDSSKEVVDENKYFKYIVDAQTTIYIKHFNTLFVLWDFEKMKKVGTPSSHALSSRWLEDREFDFEEDEPPNCVYWDMTVFLDALIHFYRGNSDTLDYLKSVYLAYTYRFINNDKKREVDVDGKNYTVKELLIKLSAYLENTVLLHNTEISPDQITATFDLRKKGVKQSKKTRRKKKSKNVL